MRKGRALPRLERLALGFAFVSPLLMLALAPDGWAALAIVLVAGILLAAAYGLYRLALRGRPRPPRRPALVPPPVERAPAAVRVETFRVRRRGRVVVAGTLDEVIAAARAGALRASDLVSGGGVEAPPAELADLVPYVPSRWEARMRAAYLSYLGLAVVAGACGIALLAAARLSGAGLERGALLVLLYAAALLPLPSLRREWRRVAAGRAEGLVPEPPPRRSLGNAALDAALAGATPGTRAVLVAVVAVSAAAIVLPPEVLLDRLSKDNDAIRSGEIWRLVTAGLVHGGAFHLFMNAAVLSNIGQIVERLLGTRRMLIVLWGGVIAGSLASFATNPHRSVGISGGLFALVGSLLVMGLRHRRALPPPARRMLVRAPIEIIVLNVALGFALPIIDNAAHLGGLAGGVLIALAVGTRAQIRAALGASPGAAPPPEGRGGATLP